MPRPLPTPLFAYKATNQRAINIYCTTAGDRLPLDAKLRGVVSSELWRSPAKRKRRNALFQLFPLQRVGSVVWMVLVSLLGARVPLCPGSRTGCDAALQPLLSPAASQAGGSTLGTKDYARL
ncbi:unnamed protein product [Arctogadus glacialis]